MASEASAALGTERRGARRGGGLVAFCLRPDVRLDQPSRSEIDLAGSIIAGRLRQEDGFDLRDDGAFMVVLANTDLQATRVVAWRLASEISLRSAAVKRRNWIAEIIDAPPLRGTLPVTRRRRA